MSHCLRGFSAGSFSGFCFLHILWPIPGVGILDAIACPPALLTMIFAKEEDTLYLGGNNLPFLPPVSLGTRSPRTLSCHI